MRRVAQVLEKAPTPTVADHVGGLSAPRQGYQMSAETRLDGRRRTAAAAIAERGIPMRAWRGGAHHQPYRFAYIRTARRKIQ